MSDKNRVYSSPPGQHYRFDSWSSRSRESQQQRMPCDKNEARERRREKERAVEEEEERRRQQRAANKGTAEKEVRFGRATIIPNNTASSRRKEDGARRRRRKPRAPEEQRSQHREGDQEPIHDRQTPTSNPNLASKARSPPQPESPPQTPEDFLASKARSPPQPESPPETPEDFLAKEEAKRIARLQRREERAAVDEEEYLRKAKRTPLSYSTTQQHDPSPSSPFASGAASSDFPEPPVLVPRHLHPQARYNDPPGFPVSHSTAPPISPVPVRVSGRMGLQQMMEEWQISPGSSVVGSSTRR
ncbi:hypothetical protein QBC41DRAFT_325926 [Cercophora samala]|uniref:Uncharacterized protein n=1 Tax=Cercophora samala TaxID=330535 RepID=A0AA40D942_9PEZI|nr:hypothetical protein QBC41DRAFT_325926 [Cercophora samala]